VKDVHDRLGDAATARFEIDEALHPTAPASEAPAAASVATWWRQPIPWLLAAATMAAGLALGLIWNETPPAPSVTRLEVTLPPGDWFSDEAGDLALSLDGRVLVYTASRNGVVYLFTRGLDQLEPTLIPGTEGASVPVVFSDASGEWIAFATPGPGAQLKKVRLSGGPPETLATAQTRIHGIDVSPTGDLIFGQHTGGLLRVPARGGTAQAVTTAAPEGPHRFPMLLPNDDVLLTVGSVPVENQIALRARGGGPLRKLTAGTDARYLPTGHLAYWLAGSLWAAPFDQSRLNMGAALQVVPDVRVRGTGKAAFAWARNGSLAYVPAKDVPRRTLVWIDRGKEIEVPVRPGPYLAPRLSPDETKVLLAYRTPDTEDIWIADLARGTAEPFMQEPTSEWLAIWTSDGEAVMFSSRRAGAFNIYTKRANGLGTIEPLGPDSAGQPAARSPAGGELLYFDDRSVWLLSIADGKSRRLWDDGMGVTDARFSPDGHWIAYTARQGHEDRVWIRPYPDVLSDRKGIGAGTFPRWSRDGRVLFYQRGSDMMSVTVRTDGGLSVSDPVRLFAGPYAASYDVAKDGRFLMIKEPPQDPKSAADRIIVVLNWFQELTDRMR
jgi:Tol biopolymer transport system component